MQTGRHKLYSRRARRNTVGIIKVFIRGAKCTSKNSAALNRSACAIFAKREAGHCLKGKKGNGYFRMSSRSKIVPFLLPSFACLAPSIQFSNFPRPKTIYEPIQGYCRGQSWISDSPRARSKNQQVAITLVHFRIPAPVHFQKRKYFLRLAG